MSGNPSNWLSHRPALPISSTPTNVNWGGFRGLLKQYAGASAGYSLRKIGSGPVVRLRRASDSAESDFTAAELTGSVTGAELVTNGDFATDSDWTKGTGWSITGGQAVCDGSQVSSSSLTAVGFSWGTSDWHVLEINVAAASDLSGVSVYQGRSTTLIAMGLTAAGTVKVLCANNTGSTLRIDVSAGVTCTIESVSIKPYTPTAAEAWTGANMLSLDVADATDESAFATTWYDQSLSGNDATQTTAASQPKLITAGVTELENGKPALVFDGVDDYLDITSNPLTVLDNLMVSVVAKPNQSSNEYGVSLSESTERVYVPRMVSGNLNIGYDDSQNKIVDGAFSASQQLVTLSVDATTASGFKNGNAFSATPTATAETAAVVETSLVPQIGALGGSSNWNGSFQELIVYPSDQSANRTGIETNINDHYGIY